MKKLNIKPVVNKTKTYVKGHAPQILTAVSNITSIISYGLCIKESFKVKDILSEEKPVTSQRKIKTAGKIVTTMATSAGFLGLSIFSSRKSLKVSEAEKLAICARYATINTTFNRYRGNVRLMFGDDVDKMIYDGNRAVISKARIDDGEEVDRHVELKGPDVNSEYAFIFSSETAPTQWSSDMSMNKFFVECMEKSLNYELGHRQRHHMFLNEVHDKFAVPRTLAGQAVGWVLNTNNPTGDNYIRLLYREVKIVNSEGFEEDAILIDPNVDGDIRPIRFEN